MVVKKTAKRNHQIISNGACSRRVRSGPNVRGRGRTTIYVCIAILSAVSTIFGGHTLVHKFYTFSATYHVANISVTDSVTPKTTNATSSTAAKTTGTTSRAPALSPHIPAFMCSQFDEQSRIFGDLSTKYTKFYPHNTVKFGPPNHSKICGETDVRLLIGIMTRRRSSDRRSVIRETFGSLQTCNNAIMARHKVKCAQIFSSIRIVFFVGVEKLSGNSQDALQKEESQFQDVVEINVDEQYNTLTVKSIAFLHWSAAYCPRAAYVMKSDDDNFIHLGNLFEAIDHAENFPYKHFIMGDIRHDAPLYRKPTDVYYIPRSVYVNNSLPNYLIGCGYVMPQRTARLLYEAGRCIQTLYIEDLFITGMLASSLRITQVKNWCINCAGLEKEDSKLVSEFSQIAVGHHVGVDDTKRIWQTLADYFAKFYSDEVANVTGSAKAEESTLPTFRTCRVHE